MSENTCLIRSINSQLMYYFRMSKREVEDLNDQEWAELWQDLQHIRSKEAAK